MSNNSSTIIINDICDQPLSKKKLKKFIKSLIARVKHYKGSPITVTAVINYKEGEKKWIN